MTNSDMGELVLDLSGKSDDELRGLAASFERARSLMLSEPAADFFGAVADGIEGLLRRREHGAGEGEPLRVTVSPEAAAFGARMQRGLLAACADDEMS